MAKHYILLGYFIPQYSGNKTICHNSTSSNRKKTIDYKKENMKLPKNYILLKFNKNLYVKVIYYNVDRGHLLIRAQSLEDAYELTNAIRSFFAIYFGYMPLDLLPEFYLQEIRTIPKPAWTEVEFLSQLEHYRESDTFFIPNLNAGIYIPKDELDYLIKFLKGSFAKKNLLYSMNNLLESRSLLNGFMSDSYYSSHYIYDRNSTSSRILKKRYQELRYMYELAFIGAFKALESFFMVNQIKKHKIKSLFSNIKNKEIKNDTIYERQYELFLGQRKEIIYSDLIKHFLDIRNVVAAHSNSKPPRNFILSEENVYEIQSFVEELIYKVVQID